MGYFENNNKHGYGKYYYKGDKDNYLVGKFKENALYGITLQFSKEKMEKIVIMEKNKVKKTLNIQEYDEAKSSNEYAELVFFLKKLKMLK